MKKILLIMTGMVMLGCSKDDRGGKAPPLEPSVEVPVAVDDEVTTSENTDLIISDLLDNDKIFEYARITEVDTDTEKGGDITDNRDGTFTYSPPENFIGEDSFDYTICDNEDIPNCSTATVTITITAANPVAVDDAYETQEDEELTITNFLSNDELVDNAHVVSVSSEGASGTASLESDGTITYQPYEGFAGEDKFEYTICDDDVNPTCSSAVITVTVTDAGSPEAVDDVVVINAGAGEVALDEVLENDIVVDDAFIRSVGNATHGSTTFNAEGTILYKVEAGFTGEDTFTYRLCDDDTPQITCSEATVTVKVVESIAFDIPAELLDYYTNFAFSTDADSNFEFLSDLTSDQHTNMLSYGERHNYLYDADEDPENPENVILMYTGESRFWKEYQSPNNPYEPQTFNTEHIYPQSKLSSNDAVTDLHHLRVADADINSQRLNHPFTEGSGEAHLVEGNYWYPGDQWKGDVARMVMYLNIRYGETFLKVGSLELFLEWNAEDPVSAFEIQRNNIISAAQGNRNPFIDNPYLATLIWGGIPAENRW